MVQEALVMFFLVFFIEAERVRFKRTFTLKECLVDIEARLYILKNGFSRVVPFLWFDAFLLCPAPST